MVANPLLPPDGRPVYPNVSFWNAPPPLYQRSLAFAKFSARSRLRTSFVILVPYGPCIFGCDAVFRPELAAQWYLELQRNPPQPDAGCIEDRISEGRRHRRCCRFTCA